MIEFFKCPTKKKINCAGRGLLNQCKGCDDVILKDGEMVVIAKEEQKQCGMMVYMQSSSTRCFVKCNCASFFAGIPEDGDKSIEDIPITNYATAEEAYKDGWHYTNHIHFCPPDKVAQWVCPECSKDFSWEKETKVIKRAYDNRVTSYSQGAINGK